MLIDVVFSVKFICIFLRYIRISIVFYFLFLLHTSTTKNSLQWTKGVTYMVYKVLCITQGCPTVCSRYTMWPAKDKWPADMRLLKILIGLFFENFTRIRKFLSCYCINISPAAPLNLTSFKLTRGPPYNSKLSRCFHKFSRGATCIIAL